MKALMLVAMVGTMGCAQSEHIYVPTMLLSLTAPEPITIQLPGANTLETMSRGQLVFATVDTSQVYLHVIIRNTGKTYDPAGDSAGIVFRDYDLGIDCPHWNGELGYDWTPETQTFKMQATCKDDPTIEISGIIARVYN